MQNHLSNVAHPATCSSACSIKDFSLSQVLIHHTNYTNVSHGNICYRKIFISVLYSSVHNVSTLSLSVLTAIYQVNLGQPVFIEAKGDGGGGDNWTTGAIRRAKL